MLCQLVAIRHALHRIRAGSAEPVIVVLAKLPHWCACEPRAYRFDDGMSNLLSKVRALIVGVPKASTEQPLPIVDSPLSFTPPPLAVTRRKYARSPLKVRGGRARAREPCVMNAGDSSL